VRDPSDRCVETQTRVTPQDLIRTGKESAIESQKAADASTIFHSLLVHLDGGVAIVRLENLSHPMADLSPAGIVTNFVHGSGTFEGQLQVNKEGPRPISLVVASPKDVHRASGFA